MLPPKASRWRMLGLVNVDELLRLGDSPGESAANS
jgi:hypothetical protein